MNNRNVKATERIMSGENNCDLLSLDKSISDGDVSHKSVRDILKEKHSDPPPYYEEAILDWKCQPSEVHSILLDKRDGLLIREIALKFSVALVDYVLGLRTNRFIYVAL